MSGLPEKLARTILDLVKKYLKDEYKIDLANVKGTLGSGHGGTGGSGGTRPSGAAGGDLYDTYPDPKVGKIRTLTVTSDAPSDGDFLMWDATNNKLVWRSAVLDTPADAVTDSGDLVMESGVVVTEP